MLLQNVSRKIFVSGVRGQNCRLFSASRSVSSARKVSLAAAASYPRRPDRDSLSVSVTDWRKAHLPLNDISARPCVRVCVCSRSRSWCAACILRRMTRRLSCYVAQASGGVGGWGGGEEVRGGGQLITDVVLRRPRGGEEVFSYA